MHSSPAKVHMLKLGTMVSLSDFRALSIAESDFSELVLFNGEIEKVDKRVVHELDSAAPCVQFVHAQEFVTASSREVLLDLSSADDEVRRLSVDAVARSRDLTDSLRALGLVFHPGGIRRGVVDHQALGTNLMRSLEELGRRKLLLENMPWYYWLGKSERMVSNVGVAIKDLERYADMVDGFVLDTAHGYLSTPAGDPLFIREFLRAFGEKVKHLHVSDAAAPDREGLQIGDGKIDFSFLRNVKVPVLVEIWRGHENQGDGFRTGIRRLRSIESEG